MACRACLDIETTGLNRYRHDITVVGVCLERDGRTEVKQFYERALTARGLRSALGRADVLYTYNGSRFDLPFVRHRLGARSG